MVPSALSVARFNTLTAVNHLPVSKVAVTRVVVWILRGLDIAGVHPENHFI